MRRRLKNDCVFKDSPLPVIVERQVKKKLISRSLILSFASPSTALCSRFHFYLPHFLEVISLESVQYLRYQSSN